MADPRPLWEVIENCDAFIQIPVILRRRLIALLIRAVRDWLVPQEEEPYPAGYPAEIRQRERMRLRALLTAEADRAERRETINPGENDFDA